MTVRFTHSCPIPRVGLGYVYNRRELSSKRSRRFAQQNQTQPQYVRKASAVRTVFLLVLIAQVVTNLERDQLS